jgi:hypothetical protein
MENTGFKSWLSEHELGLYNEWVDRHVYDTYNNKTCVVVLTLRNSFEIVGTAGCEDHNRFEEALGHKYALQDALRKLDEFAAFYRTEQKKRAQIMGIAKPVEDLEPFVTRLQVYNMIEAAIKEHIKYRH